MAGAKKKTEFIENDLDPHWDEVIFLANLSLYATFHVRICTHRGRLFLQDWPGWDVKWRKILVFQFYFKLHTAVGSQVL